MIQRSLSQRNKKKYSLSKKELNICRKFDLNAFMGNSKFEEIKEIHVGLAKYYKSLNGEDES